MNRSPDQDDLDGAERLASGSLGAQHIHQAVCASTNDVAAAEARAGAREGLLVTADAQTGGRGRLGRSWHSPPGENLYMSLVLRPRRPTSEIPCLTLLTGGAIAAALRRLGFAAEVKWPNDVLLHVDSALRKVAGVLTEASSEGGRVAHVVVGIGINVNAESFPAELAGRATSLRLAAGGVRLMRRKVLAGVLQSLQEAYDRFCTTGPAAALSLWEAHASLGARCRGQGERGPVEGVTVGVAADGALLVRDDTGAAHRIVAGEVLPT